MRSHHVVGRFLAPGLVSGMLGLLAAAAPAAEYYLVAKSVEVTMPDGVSIPMWGFALDEDGGPGSPNGVGDCWESAPSSAACTGLTATVPGPALSLASGDSSLTIHLTNLLTGHPVSIVVPGQELPAGSAPVFGGGGDPSRVRSFTHEAAADGGQATYEWSGAGGNPFHPGSFLYQSGSHVQVQVQMGLYGAVARPFAVGQAYDGVAYDAEVSLLFSEIDPALHQALDSGSYGTPPGPTSTLDYQPRYFLVNGQPQDHTSPDPCVAAGAAAGDRVLLRMMNAGLRELVPMILGSHWQVVAEAGHEYPFPREQYSVLLQPGSSKDVVFTPQREGEFPILERRLNLTNAAATGGGMQLCLAVGPGGPNDPPTADANGPYAGVAGQPIAFDGSGSSDPDGDTLSYSWDFGDGNGGSGVTPSHSYAAAGSYNVTLTVDDGVNPPDADLTTASVAANSAPTADSGGPYQGRTGFAVAFDGSGSSDPDGDALSYSWDFGDGNSGSGVTPSHTYAAAGSYTVTLSVDDGVNPPVADATTAVVTDNAVPIADPNGPYSGSVGLPIAFDGSGSSDADGDALSYSWNFGDGSTGSGVSPSHAYATMGTFTVTLVVNDGFEDSAPVATSASTASPGNQAPVANDDAFNPDEVSGTVSVAAPGVLGNDSDPDAGPQPLTAQLVSPGNLTNLVLNPNGSFSWTPAGSTGVFSFTYQASDGQDLSNTATAQVTREIAVKKVDYNAKTLRWTIQGTSSASGTVTIYLGVTTGGTVLGTAAVAGNGNWSFSQTGPDRGTATSISVDNLGTAGGAVLDRPITVKEAGVGPAAGRRAF